MSEEPQLDSTVELIRCKRDPPNPKRSLGKNDTVGGRNPINPRLPTGSGIKAVCIKASLSEEERKSRSMGNPGLSGITDHQRTDRVAEGTAQLDLKVRNKGWVMLIFDSELRSKVYPWPFPYIKKRHWEFLLSEEMASSSKEKLGFLLNLQTSISQWI